MCEKYNCLRGGGGGTGRESKLKEQITKNYKITKNKYEIPN